MWTEQGPLADRGPHHEPQAPYYLVISGAQPRADPAAYALAMTPSPGTAIDTFSSEVLAIETDGHVATLWLDRPEKRNAMGPAFWSDLPLAMAAVGADPEIRAVVVAGRGPHFSLGLDLVAMSGLVGGPGSGGSGNGPASMASRARSARREILRMQASVTSIADCPLPVIAAVPGYC